MQVFIKEFLKILDFRFDFLEKKYDQRKTRLVLESKTIQIIFAAQSGPVAQLDRATAF
jgi:hypothetical protein